MESTLKTKNQTTMKHKKHNNIIHLAGFYPHLIWDESKIAFENMRLVNVNEHTVLKSSIKNSGRDTVKSFNPDQQW